jgi:putative ABC transport system permease protein
MDFKEMLFLTYSSIKERRTRNTLTILMIIMGCGLLVSLNSLSQGLVHFVEQNFKNILPNQIIISNTDNIQESSVEGIRNKLQVLFDQNTTMIGKSIPLNSTTINYLENLNGVQDIYPAYQGVAMLNYKNHSQVTNILAVDFKNINKIIPNAKLDPILSKDNDHNNVIIPEKIGEKISLTHSQGIRKDIQSNIEGREPPQQKNIVVTINKIREIIETSDKPSESNQYNLFSLLNSTGNPIIDNSIFIDVNNGKKILDKGNDYDLLFLTYDDVNKVDNLVKQIQKHFNNQITILNSMEIVKSITKFIIGVTTFISSIAVISLIVGALGIIITIYTSVVERTREIGILKALGGTNRIILGMFLTESVFVGVFGAIFGIVFGFIGSYLLLIGFLYFLDLPLEILPIFNVLEISKIAFTVIVLSIFAGLYPAYKGSKIPPVDALSKFT